MYRSSGGAIAGPGLHAVDRKPAPLGLGAAGLAILAALPDVERYAVLAQELRQVLEQGQLGEKDFLASIERARKLGHAFIRNRVTLGVSAVGVAIRDVLNHPSAAISVAAVDARMTNERIGVIAGVLHREARAIQQALKDGRGFTYD